MRPAAALGIVAVGLAMVLAGCGSNALDGPNGRPVALTVAVPAPMADELAPIVRASDPGATIEPLSPEPGPAPPADVAIAVISTDLVAHPGLLAPNFNIDAFGGRFASSVVAFGVRPGNPLAIRGWGDLLKPGVHPTITDPLGTAGGRLEVLSAATAIVQAVGHGTPARAYVLALLRRANVAPTPASAIDRFAAGVADVVVATEDRLIAARDRGVPLQIVYPPTPARVVLVVGVARDSAHPKAAQALVDALRLPGPQKALARDGLRPVLVGYAPPDRFPPLAPGHTPGIMGTPSLVAHAYFGPQGIARQAQDQR